MLDLLSIPVVCTLIEYHTCLATCEALVLLGLNILHNTCQNVTKASLTLLLLNLHEFIINKDQRVVLYSRIICRIDVLQALVDHDIVICIQTLRGTLIFLILLGVSQSIKVASDVFVDDFVTFGIFFVLPDILVPLYVPKLLQNMVLLEASLSMADMPSYTAEAILESLSLLFQHIVELKAALLPDLLSDLDVIQELSLIRLGIEESAALLFDINWQLIHHKHLMELIFSIGQFWIRGIHESQAKCLQRIDVFLEFLLLLKLIDLVFALYQCVVLHIKHLLLSLLIDQDDFIDVLLALSGYSFLVDECKDAHTCHLSHDIVSRIDSTQEVLPKFCEIGPAQITILEVCLLIEAIWLDF